MQVAHGTLAPLRRIAPGDRIAYYAPTLTLGGNDKCQAFVALGIVAPGEPYQIDLGDGFAPFRRAVRWRKTREAPIQPLLDTLDFTAGKKSWGYQLRFGLFAVSEHDMALIARAMGVENLA